MGDGVNGSTNGPAQPTHAGRSDGTSQADPAVQSKFGKALDQERSSSQKAPQTSSPAINTQEHAASTHWNQKLAPTYQNGWTYASMPGATFFEYEKGIYAYTESGSKTLHPVDNKQMSIMLKNGHPVLSKLTCSVYELPANLLDPNPGEMSSAGTRWNAQGPRQTYQNPKALDLAMAGYWKEAEIWEAGHGCAGCHIERPTNGPVPNEMLDLNRYNRVALMTKVVSDVVGAKYDPRNPMTMAHMGVSHAMNSPIASGKAHAFENDPVYIRGQETRPATPAEAARYNAGMRQGEIEIGFVERRNGKQSLIPGDTSSVHIPGGPDIKTTSHTHPNSLAIFSGGDARRYMTGGYASDVVHSVTGEKWPAANRILRESGAAPSTELMTTVARQSSIDTVGATSPSRLWSMLVEYLRDK
jgi:hypothetical protein